MSTVAIIDYGMGNLDSVARAVEVCGGTPVVTCDEADIKTASAAILPGVGAFPDGMKELKARFLDTILREHVVDAQIPLLGICLGMQLLASKGVEGAETPGLGFIPGEVRRLEPEGPDTRIPHVGWNEVHPVSSCDP
ncbi:MAG: imidazole glycerol phosphate synthase subunit HisH, partial [bacterium]|nr:imidazole glycerol phosphate synthase subunit HisH [bacterium]